MPFVKSKVTSSTVPAEPTAIRGLRSVPTPGEKRKYLNQRRKLLAAKQRGK